jgi:predicted GH43/DUF377 family glycosyl hydrolase
MEPHGGARAAASRDIGESVPIAVEHLPVTLGPDPHRVIIRFFGTGDAERARHIIERVSRIPETEVEHLLSGLVADFEPKHPRLLEAFSDHFEQVHLAVPEVREWTESRRLFLGACFTMEYALESVAVFNPSIVPALRQDGVPEGSVRFVMSLRATGEGHVSSIIFRIGMIDASGQIDLEPAGTQERPLKATVPDAFDKTLFQRDLATLGVQPEPARRILGRLGPRFTCDELASAIAEARRDERASGLLEETGDIVIAATQANYHLELPGPPLSRESEIVIFPFSDIERHGIEDLRLVLFTEDDGRRIYYGTFTAYNGVRVFPQLLRYSGGNRIDVRLLTGACARNKGMALFPRRINGQFAMISRIDNENLYYMQSDDVDVWEEARLLQTPEFPWQIVLIGNCGSPLETEAGWLLLTHGVGPMRQYCIGATLLDRDEPWRVIAQTREPILVPSAEGRSSGYVPNVVYSCGAMIHNDHLIIPYAISDLTTGAVRVDLGELLASLRS